jgi:hypothetical protein
LVVDCYHNPVWISAKDLEPNQYFGHNVLISCPRVGQMRAAESVANILASQYWRG